MNNIQLRFVNNSNGQSYTDVVVFQQEAQDNKVIAWTAIRNCGVGEFHPFTYTDATEVSASDSDGNYTQCLASAPGDVFAMVRATSGNELRFDHHDQGQVAVAVENRLPEGAIAVYMYRSGRVFMEKTHIFPGMKLMMQFTPRIFIARASSISQDVVVTRAVIDSTPAPIDLKGIASADIVMQGGGTEPLQFALANVVYA